MTSSTLLGGISAKNFSNFLAADKHALFSELLRTAKFPEAKAFLVEQMTVSEGEEKLLLAIDLSQVEWATKHYTEALRVLTEHFPLTQTSANHDLLWRFHLLLGATYQLLAGRECRDEYIDRALREYAGAVYHQTHAGAHEQAGLAENNIGFILAGLGRFDEAREHFDKARVLLAGRLVELAEVDDSEAQVSLMEGGKAREAYHLALKANLVFIEHDEERLLRESTLTLQAAAAAFRLTHV